MTTICNFRNLLAVAATTMLFPATHAQDSAGDKRGTVLIERSAIELPPHKDVAERPLMDLYATRDEYTRARDDDTFVMERIVYSSDGLHVVALLYRARTFSGPKPTIVFNRGSYVRQDTAPEYLVSFHRLASAGYAILAPMYRGSEGAAGHDQMGGDELNDLMTVVELAGDLASVDDQRLYLMGESRGGMMVLQAIRDGFPALAAAVYGAPTDFERLFADYPQQYEPVADQLWPGWRDHKDEVLGRRSAVAWAGMIDVPLLIMHGGRDESMPVNQSLALATRLEALDKTYELHIYAYENHMISGRAAARDAQAVDWFRRRPK